MFVQKKSSDSRNIVITKLQPSSLTQFASCLTMHISKPKLAYLLEVWFKRDAFSNFMRHWEGFQVHSSNGKSEKTKQNKTIAALVQLSIPAILVLSGQTGRYFWVLKIQRPLAPPQTRAAVKAVYTELSTLKMSGN